LLMGRDGIHRHMVRTVQSSHRLIQVCCFLWSAILDRCHVE
jgi:hypothetical protein